MVVILQLFRFRSRRVEKSLSVSIKPANEVRPILVSVRRWLRPQVQNRRISIQREVDHRQGLRVNHEGVVTRVQYRITHAIHSRQTSQRQVQARCRMRTRRDAVQTLIRNEGLLGVRRRAELASQETKRDVVRSGGVSSRSALLASVLDLHVEGVEGAVLLVRHRASCNQRGNADVLLRERLRERSAEVCVVQSCAKFEDGAAIVPFVSAAGVVLAGTQGHVGHGDLLGVDRGVLRGGETTGRGNGTGEDVEHGGTAVLAWDSAPEEGRNVGVGDDWGTL